MVVLDEEATCSAAMGEENDERVVTMASFSLVHNSSNNATRAGGTSSPTLHLAATPDGNRHLSDHPRRSARNEDDELTSLSWLQDTNLLRNIRAGVPQEEPEEEDDEEDLSHSPFSDDCQEEEEREESPVPGQTGADREGIPYGHITYNPRIHISAKPPYSFSCLIFMAIEDTPNKALPVKEIYAWIVRHFPYYQNAPTGWKNSVRHNLSLNKCFRKVEKDKGQNVGKGSLWCIDPEFRPNLLQTLKKAPQCPFSQLEDVPPALVRTQAGLSSNLPADDENVRMELDANECSQGANLSHTNVPSPDLFPYLAKRLSVSTVKSSEVDAAATMLALKNGASHPSSLPKAIGEEEKTNKAKLKVKRKKKNNRFRNNPAYKQENVSPTNAQPPPAHRKPKAAASASPPATAPVITSSPSEDHTYSASPSQPSSGSDHNSRSGSPTPPAQEQRNNGVTAAQEEEEARIAKEEERSLEEGAQALLSLAKNSLWGDPKRTLVLFQTTSSER